MGVESKLRDKIHARKKRREKTQGRTKLREARAIQKLRALLDAVHAEPRVMFDDVTLSLVPDYAKAVGFYVNGSYENEQECADRFPDARRVSITVRSDGMASALDIEPGDATNADAVRWFQAFKHLHPHLKPIFYTSASNVLALTTVLSAAGIRRNEYIIWSAHYNGKRHICGRACGYPKAEATQWTDNSNDRSLDESKVSPEFWHRHAA